MAARAVLFAVLLPAVVAVLALPAAAEEEIPAYDVVLTVRPDGVVHVHETVTYDFSGGDDHGIVRRVPYREGRRVYGVHRISTSSSTGAPARARVRTLPRDVRITVGGGTPVGGRQAYVIEYDVTGLLTPFPKHDELVWDALGTAWDVPVAEAAVRVEGPVRFRAGCRAGDPPLTPCLRHRDGPRAIVFSQRGLAPHEGMLVKARLPKGAVAVPPPRFAPPRWRGGGVGGVLLLLGVVAAVWTVRGPPVPRAAPPVLAALGTALVAGDLAASAARDGLWLASAGSPAAAGAALLAGAAAGARTRRAARRPARTAPVVGREE